MTKKDTDANTLAVRPPNAPRKRFDSRRVLIATLGAATVNYAVGCGSDTLFTSVANLMAPPFLPPASGNGGTGGESGIDGPMALPVAGSHASDADAGTTVHADEDAGTRR
jgi:hypothetical protein